MAAAVKMVRNVCQPKTKATIGVFLLKNLKFPISPIIPIFFLSLFSTRIAKNLFLVFAVRFSKRYMLILL